MDTFYSSHSNQISNDLSEEMNLIRSNPVINTLLESVGGIFALLNYRREIIAANDTFLNSVGTSDIYQIAGCKLGEALKCKYAYDPPTGCGTSKACGTCGAAIAISSTLQNRQTYENICIIKRDVLNSHKDLMFNIKSNHIEINNQAYILVFLQDISKEQELSALEQVFFHDINNIITGINGAVSLLQQEVNKDEMLKVITNSCYRLHKEIELQRCLSTKINQPYQVSLSEITIDDLYDELTNLLSTHPSYIGKTLLIDRGANTLLLNTDIAIVLKVLTNMVLNAFEAIEPGDVVTMNSKITSDKELTFSVHNDSVIPPADRQRVFQRNFSTKGMMGRGLGTYSMKLFGEDILGGKVSFTSNQIDGTIFNFVIPL